MNLSLVCTLMEGKIICTLCYDTNEEGKHLPRVKKENHLTLVSEPKSEFVSSLADDHIDDDDLKGAELEAKFIRDTFKIVGEFISCTTDTTDSTQETTILDCWRWIKILQVISSVKIGLIMRMFL